MLQYPLSLCDGLGLVGSLSDPPALTHLLLPWEYTPLAVEGLDDDGQLKPRVMVKMAFGGTQSD